MYIAKAKVGDYCNEEGITNKDDFKDWAIFKVILGSKDSKKLKTYKENLEQLKKS